MKPAIEVCNLSKRYPIGSLGSKRYLREVLGSFWKTRFHSSLTDHFWALKEVNFKIVPGETVGIIGNNGSGKSTLLKILARITALTKGQAIIRGRTASILEVGAGFHPDLTGRENVYLSGSVLGMKSAVINRLFAEIVSFSEVEKFLDMPVKHYSSGMYLRLAFAVAAHLEYDILLIDEVLAVGDARFQTKCLEKIKTASTQGKTILLVSHNLGVVQTLASKVIYLEKGETKGLMPTQKAVNLYLYGDHDRTKKAVRWSQSDSAKEAYILQSRTVARSGRNTARFKVNEPVIIEISWRNMAGVAVNPNLALTNDNGVTVLVASDVNVDWDGTKKQSQGEYVSRVEIPGNLLNTGYYHVSVALDNARPPICYDSRQNILTFLLWDPMNNDSLARGPYRHERSDAVLWPVLRWTWKKN